ncbi:MAG: hypothetical protein LBJ02_11990 [Bifidobacteriaceae bacterium]|jgi:hypothetical protein|nr:hypothetical protein [Bifidobacteriaceae bacterium]
MTTPKSSVEPIEEPGRQSRDQEKDGSPAVPPAPTIPTARYRKPAAPPGPQVLLNIEEWTDLVDTSLERVTSSAQRWQTGLAGFIGVITTVLLLEGGRAPDLRPPWRYIILGLLLGAVLLGIVGLWKALEAAAPSHSAVTYDAVVAKYVTIRAYKIAAANAAIARLRSAKRLVAAACVLLIIAIALWWLAPR